MAAQLPTDVLRYVGQVFRQCNRRICRKLAAVPNVAEPSLDMTFVEHLTQYSSPIVLSSDWIVRIDTHYLGGLRHFYRWEIADIGVLIFFRRAGRVIRRKVALLQSKRLYPTNSDINDETAVDYKIGFAHLATDDSVAPLGLRRQFNFDEDCRYSALKVGDEQYSAIQEYEKSKNIPVHYLFYDPWNVPSTYTLPLTTPPVLKGTGNGGCRVLPYRILADSLSGRPDGFSPRLTDVGGLLSGGARHHYGWKLEHFVAQLLLRCKEGRIFTGSQDEDIQSLFFRRSGPIAAAISVSVEMPESAEFEQ